MSKDLMVPLNLPQATLKIKRSGTQFQVWDVLRKKWLILTPEEWVRQHIIHYLNSELAIPFSLMNVEYGIKIKSALQRVDILVRDNTKKPVLIVECKAPDVRINEHVESQISSYNYLIGAPFLFMSNGINHFFYKLSENKNWEQLAEIPVWKEMKR